MKILIKNAKLRRTDGTRDLEIVDGKIARIERQISASGSNHSIDAQGRLVTSGFVNSHVHLDKCLTGDWIRTTVDASTGSLDVIPAAASIKKRFTEDDVAKRAGRAIDLSLVHGVTAIRSFVDADSVIGLTALKGMLRAKKEYRQMVDLQLVAFPQEGIIRDPGAEELLYKAMEMGADVVGGIPWYEYTEEDSKRHTDIVFEVAKRFQKDAHFLVDDNEDTNSKNVEYLLAKSLKENYQGRTAASHCRGALESPNDSYAKKIISMAKRAGFTVVENPHISLMMYGRNDKFPLRRGITRVREFLNAGVNVAIGQDDIDDPFYPFGRGDMLELAYFMCHSAYLGSLEEFETAYDMITTNGAKMMHLPNYGINPQGVADLVIHDSKNVHESLQMQRPPLFVLSKGQIIVENKTNTKLNRVYS